MLDALLHSSVLYAVCVDGFAGLKAVLFCCMTLFRQTTSLAHSSVVQPLHLIIVPQLCNSILVFRASCNQVLVGPGTPRPAQPITSPPDAASFISSATTPSNNDNSNNNNESSGGLIIVAFGTSLSFTSWLNREDFEQLALGFGALAPARVLWILQEDGLPHGLKLADLPLAENTKVRLQCGSRTIRILETTSGTTAAVTEPACASAVLQRPRHGLQAWMPASLLVRVARRTLVFG
jgi:hypothetical protein